MSDVSDKAKQDYHTRLKASVGCVRWLLVEGCSFRGHDESETASRPGKFLSLLKYSGKLNEDIQRVTLKNAPENLKLVAPSIQKDIAHAAATLITQAIVEDIGDSFFTLLIDEARDAADKEQMAVALRYVDKHGCIVERFLGIVHVMDTTAKSLKAAIELIISKHGLSLSNVRGQGYDGASNMSGQFNGLKSLILVENKSAFYVHCFAHQLQLAMVAAASNIKSLSDFFDYVSLICNVVGASSKRKDILRIKRIQQVIDGVSSGDLETGQGWNQELCLARPGATRWSSHYRSVVSLLTLFNPVIDVLQVVADDGTNRQKKMEVIGLLKQMQTFEFVLLLNLMVRVLGLTNDLSQALQRRDQDLVNSIKLVKLSKDLLQQLRENWWDDLFEKTCDFCVKQHINVPDMECILAVQGRKKHGDRAITHLHYFKNDIFHVVIDTQLQELNDRFTDVNNELLLYMACLDPRKNFFEFDVKRLCEFATFYPVEFNENELLMLEVQLYVYIAHVRSSSDFSNLMGIADLARKMVEKGIDKAYPLVFLLMKLALTLPVATTTVERAFSVMKIVKTRLRATMSDDWMNDCLVTYIEHDIFDSIDDELIMKYFQDMKSRRMIL